jgi:hypothetical protein
VKREGFAGMVWELGFLGGSTLKERYCCLAALHNNLAWEFEEI